jgi:hypothetical protein
MKKKWLNLVLLLTNRIYSRKKQVIDLSGLSVFVNIFVLIFLEIALGILSMPLYLGMKSGGVTAFFSEKGVYKKISFDYSLRRVLTLTGVGIIALIWVAKLVLIVALPATYGPLQLYTVSNFSKADLLTKNIISSEIGIQTARVMDSMSRPEITMVKKQKGGDYSFYGKGNPNTMVVLLLSDQQTAVYSTTADKNGNWQIDHSQSGFQLKPGNHSLVVFNYDQKLGVRSGSAPEQFFKVTSTIWDSISKNVDVLANWSALIILILGVVLTLLTI